MDLTAARPNSVSFTAFTNTAQNTNNNGFIKKLHDSWGFMTKHMAVEHNNIAYRYDELLRD